MNFSFTHGQARGTLPFGLVESRVVSEDASINMFSAVEDSAAVESCITGEGTFNQYRDATPHCASGFG
jgi:hypothetical protein